MIVFCDLDGTLIDSSERHIVLLDFLLKEHSHKSGMPELWSLDDYLPFKAAGQNTTSYLLKHGVPVSLAEEIAFAWRNHIEDADYLELDTVYSDTFAFLKEIISAGHTIAYVSARKNKEGLKNTLKRLCLQEFAKEIYIVDPAHAAQEKADALRDCSCEQGVFIGDTEADWNCAMLAGIPCVVLNRGFRSKSYWDHRGVESYGDLASVLRALAELNFVLG